MLRPKIIEELCTGCGICETICPDVFEIGADGLSHVIAEDICDSVECCEEAIENCPEEAIVFEETD